MTHTRHITAAFREAEKAGQRVAEVVCSKDGDVRIVLAPANGEDHGDDIDRQIEKAARG